MNWFDWTLVILLGANTLIIIGSIGKQREPITPLVAAVNTLLTGLLIAGIIIFRG